MDSGRIYFRALKGRNWRYRGRPQRREDFGGNALGFPEPAPSHHGFPAMLISQHAYCFVIPVKVLFWVLRKRNVACGVREPKGSGSSFHFIIITLAAGKSV
jgi:hypothetical protein